MNFHKFNECLISTQIKREWEKKRKRIRQKGLKKKGKGENERGERRKGEKTKEGKKGEREERVLLLLACAHVTSPLGSSNSSQRFLMSIWPEVRPNPKAAVIHSC